MATITTANDNLAMLRAYLTPAAEAVREGAPFRTVELNNTADLAADCRAVAQELAADGLTATVTPRGESLFVIISAGGHDPQEVLTDRTLTEVNLRNGFHTMTLNLKQENGAFVFGAVCLYNTEGRGRYVEGTHTHSFGTFAEAQRYANRYFTGLTGKNWKRTS